jgi:hypothetical protein
MMARKGGGKIMQDATAAPKVWLDMDQAALDAAYDQSVYAPNQSAVHDRRMMMSAIALQRAMQKACPPSLHAMRAGLHRLNLLQASLRSKSEANPEANLKAN